MGQDVTKPPLYVLDGRVVHDRGIGRLVGMPTANLELLPGSSLPPVGVYIAQAVLDGQTYGAVTHIGPRPTVDGDPRPSIETHILEFDCTIYGQRLELRLFACLRGPRKFADLSHLLVQVQADCAAARAYFGMEPPAARLELDAAARRVRLGQRMLELSEKEFALLSILYGNSRTVFTKEQLYEAVWGLPANGCCHAVENTVFQIRKKLRACGAPDLIRTVVGRGYRFGWEEQSGKGSSRREKKRP